MNYAPESYDELMMAAMAGNGCTNCLATTHLEEDCPDLKPCGLCGVYPGDPHNGEAHLAEMRAAEYAMYERDMDPGWDDARRDDYPEPFQASFATEAEAQAFAASLDDTPENVSQWPPQTGPWYVEHYDKEAHERWLRTDD